MNGPDSMGAVNVIKRLNNKLSVCAYNVVGPRMSRSAEDLNCFLQSL